MSTDCGVTRISIVGASGLAYHRTEVPWLGVFAAGISATFFCQQSRERADIGDNSKNRAKNFDALLVTLKKA